ncbi:hypothetical protein BDZ91DRAFT_795232 [Kalaharituber pfeilii]|nr:hypothetical protein BDZ91DRAFT_795232 [Kalaharituber pfeilii]
MSSAVASASTSASRPLINSNQKGQLMLDQAIKGFTQLRTPQQKATIQNGPPPEREQIRELTTEIADKILLKFQVKKYTALNYFQYFSKLTALLERIGKLVPIFDKFEELFDSNLKLKDAVAEFSYKLSYITYSLLQDYICAICSIIHISILLLT